MPSELDQKALAAHAALKGKVHTLPADGLTPETLALYYTPGVGAVSRHLAEHPEEASLYTGRGNLVAVVSDGSAVLGLGNIGPEGALPVMEGKAMLFKSLAGVDAVPIVLSTQDPLEIIAAVKAIAPSFGGINLEDIAAPHCYQIEDELKAALSIPVMHDDQHATAIAVLAGLINSCRVTNRDIKQARVAIIGAGAAGGAVARLLVEYGISDVVVVDSKGILSNSRTDLDLYKQALLQLTNPRGIVGGFDEALTGADAVVGLSVGGHWTTENITTMAPQSIVFALANPNPEILPEDARAGGAAVVATGRSDYPNQINNVLVFPGIFKGAFAHNVKSIDTNIKLNVAEALANLVDNPSVGEVMPSVFDNRVVDVVVEAVGK